jgi:hypothetical protein
METRDDLFAALLLLGFTKHDRHSKSVISGERWGIETSYEWASVGANSPYDSSLLSALSKKHADIAVTSLGKDSTLIEHSHGKQSYCYGTDYPKVYRTIIELMEKTNA